MESRVASSRAPESCFFLFFFEDECFRFSRREEREREVNEVSFAASIRSLLDFVETSVKTFVKTFVKTSVASFALAVKLQHTGRLARNVRRRREEEPRERPQLAATPRGKRFSLFFSAGSDARLPRGAENRFVSGRTQERVENKKGRVSLTTCLSSGS
jgi:hypothetical protein